MSPATKTFSWLGVAAAALCLASAGLPSAALAQDQAAAPMADGAQHGPDHAKMEERRKAHQERRAHRLHDLLQIRSDQEPAFQAFLADMKPPMRDHKDWATEAVDRKDLAGLTTPERLDRTQTLMTQRVAERQAAFARRADAIKKFYAVLTPEQKRAFDALHEHAGGGERGMGHRGGPGEDGPGGGGHEHGWAG